jgi:hypothetical protein
MQGRRPWLGPGTEPAKNTLWSGKSATPAWGSGVGGRLLGLDASPLTGAPPGVADLLLGGASVTLHNQKARIAVPGGCVDGLTPQVRRIGARCAAVLC